MQHTYLTSSPSKHKLDSSSARSITAPSWIDVSLRSDASESEIIINDGGLVS